MLLPGVRSRGHAESHVEAHSDQTEILQCAPPSGLSPHNVEIGTTEATQGMQVAQGGVLKAKLPNLLTAQRGNEYLVTPECNPVDIETEHNSNRTPDDLDLSPLQYEDFQVLDLLGHGGFSEVDLVRCHRDGKLYAMKAVQKMALHERRHVGDRSAGKRAQLERDIGVAARQWHCPFIVELCATFQTPEMLYYIYEYCSGGELLTLLQAQPEHRFREGEARFYLAEVTLALEHLHAHSTIHRDVRLENMLLAADGHIKLADMGCAKNYTSCFGTAPSLEVALPPVFMPPEMLRGELYGKDMDCWQLGIAAFAMLSGKYPIEGMDWPGKLPEDVSNSAMSLCSDLLHRERQERLGHPDGACVLRSHLFFENTDWHTMIGKDMQPPFAFDGMDDVDTPCAGIVRHEEHEPAGRDILFLRNFSFAKLSLFKRITG